MRGKNFQRLVVHKMSVDAIPSGGGLADGIKFLTNPSGIAGAARAATEWAAKAVDSVRAANRPNPFMLADDETIATEIMRKLDEVKTARKIVTESQ